MADEQKSGGEGSEQAEGDKSTKPKATDKPENKLDPSAPGETGTTPGSNSPAN